MNKYLKTYWRSRKIAHFTDYIDEEVDYAIKLQDVELLVKLDPYFMSHINNPSEEQQLIAVQNAPSSITYIKNPTEEAQLLAVQRSPYLIKSIENPTEKVQLYVVNKIPYLINDIKNPTEEVQLIANKWRELQKIKKR